MKVNMNKNIIFITLSFLLICGGLKGQVSGKNYKQLPGTPIAHYVKSTGQYVGSPSIVILPSGEYLASHDIFGSSGKGGNVHVYKSKDKGKSWKHIAVVPEAFWAGLFIQGKDVYLLGREMDSHNLAIWRSVDSGKTWSEPSILRIGNFHGSTTPVIQHNNRIYKGYDNLGIEDKKKPWMSQNKSFIMSAAVNSDLMDPNNWIYTNGVAKPDTLEGSGWLETNAVLGKNNNIIGITRLQTAEGMSAGMYALENDSVISPNSIRSIPFIGGATKFNILWDSKTQKYWSITNYPPEIIRSSGMRAGGMRSILTLISSPDLLSWKINAILIASENIDFHGFQYVDWCFEGKDIIYVSRTAFDDEEGGAERAHDANYLTFHRIKNYKSVKTPKKHRYLLSGKK